MDRTFQVRFCLYDALDKLDEVEIMEEYGNVVGLGGLEWIDIFDENYRRGEWMMTDEWTEHMIQMIVTQWTDHSYGEGVPLTNDQSCPGGDSQLLSQVVADHIPPDFPTDIFS